ncbi:MAG: sugar transferase [Rhodocyclales bacterium]|nr:sugar transferase [Rhodocyclales bacterium]
MKRVCDFLVAAFALILTAPLLLLLIVLIRLRLGSPVFFRQQRPGLRGQPFMLCKFRSMSDACDANGALLPDHLRLGRFGSTLRRLSLDELPQLWNVLKGDMSLVGPRPLLMKYLERYSSHQTRRHDVRPGITGWAQVNGRNAISWEERLELDVWYVDHRSLWLDARILGMTVRKVCSGKDVSSKGHATMPEFMGNAKEKR